LGTDVCAVMRQRGHDVVSCDSDGFDIADPIATLRFLNSESPSAVIHCAAYTNVDGCEKDPDRAFRVNSIGCRSVASACTEIGARLVAVSTDFVFDGTKSLPYTELDPTNPQNVYGASKLAGEEAIREVCPRHQVVRTSWLFGVNGKSFPGIMIDAARAGKDLRVVSDQHGTPTYTVDLATTTADLLDLPIFGTFHVSNTGICSWHEFAVYALKLAGLEIVSVAKIKASDWPSPTKRPAYSALRSHRLELLGQAPLRGWQDALKDYVRLREALSR